MLSCKTIFITTSALLVAGLVGAASGFFADRPVRDETPVPDGPGPVPFVSPFPERQPAVPPVYAKPDFFLDVYFDHRKATEEQARLFQQIQNHFNEVKIAAPEARIAYFRCTIDHITHPVEGWSGLIHSVKPIEGGVVVELRIFAKQGGMVDTTNIIERYSHVDGMIEYLGFYVPNDIPRFQVGY